jgi:hypothetical protein
MLVERFDIREEIARKIGMDVHRSPRRWPLAMCARGIGRSRRATSALTLLLQIVRQSSRKRCVFFTGGGQGDWDDARKARGRSRRAGTVRFHTRHLRGFCGGDSVSALEVHLIEVRRVAAGAEHSRQRMRWAAREPPNIPNPEACGGSWPPPLHISWVSSI